MKQREYRQIILTKRDLARLREWRRRLPLPVAAFSWMGLATAGSTCASVVACLIAFSQPSTPSALPSYTVSIISAADPRLLPDPVPPRDDDSPVPLHEEPAPDDPVPDKPLNDEPTVPPDVPPQLAMLDVPAAEQKPDVETSAPDMSPVREPESVSPPLPVQERGSLQPEPIVSTATVVGEVRSNYWQEVYSAIAQEVHYPMSARRRGIEGDVILELLIDRRGVLQNAEARESATSAFSRSVLTAARRAAPYPSLPEELGDSVDLDIPVSFRIGNNP